MRLRLIIGLIVFFNFKLIAQVSFNEKLNQYEKLFLDSGISLTFDEPIQINPTKPTKIILFALPNGNSTAQSYGKILSSGDDWHFDIQHIGAQTSFIRNTDKQTNYIVVYLENTLKSWPAWRSKFKDDNRINKIVTYIYQKYSKYTPKLILTCHSGGGSFIFGYLNSLSLIPSYIDRIGFLDATYGYESEKHKEKLIKWLKTKNKSLQVISYNDSVVVYNGKPLVSPTGGTWFRSQLMVKDLQTQFKLKKIDLVDRFNWSNRTNLIDFKLIKNPEAKIYHTVLVEKNGFIQLIFNGTNFSQKSYKFWEERAYTDFILN